MSVPRNKFRPSHIRGVPVPKEPTTIGGQLRLRRLQLRIHQSELARQLNVSTVSLSRWETDKLIPSSEYHARIVEFLGYNSLTNGSE